MRKRLSFEVYGYDDVEIERRARRVIAEYLLCEPDDVDRRCEIEVEIFAKSQITDESDGELTPEPAFIGKVYARIK